MNRRNGGSLAKLFVFEGQNYSLFSSRQEKRIAQVTADKTKMCLVDFDRRNDFEARKKIKDTTMWDARSLREAMVRWDGIILVTISQLGFPAGGERRSNTQLPAAIATMAG